MAPNPSYLLTGKVALVTGSSRGMGRAVALELANRGANIVVNFTTNNDAASAVVEQIKNLGRDAIAIRADMSQPNQIASLFSQAVERFGKLDIVVSNSGVESFGHISEITPEEFDRVFKVNTRGQLLVAQQAYRFLTHGGHLVLFASISAEAKGVKNHAIYSGSKAAVEAFARCLAVDMGDKKIRVNAVAPGGIKTDMYVDAARKYIPGGESMSDEKVEEITANASPLKRVGEPEDVARVVAFLASEDGSWMNGQTLTIGGGAAL